MYRILNNSLFLFIRNYYRNIGTSRLWCFLRMSSLTSCRLLSITCTGAKWMSRRTSWLPSWARPRLWKSKALLMGTENEPRAGSGAKTNLACPRWPQLWTVCQRSQTQIPPQQSFWRRRQWHRHQPRWWLPHQLRHQRSFRSCLPWSAFQTSPATIPTKTHHLKVSSTTTNLSATTTCWTTTTNRWPSSNPRLRQRPKSTAQEVLTKKTGVTQSIIPGSTLHKASPQWLTYFELSIGDLINCEICIFWLQQVIRRGTMTSRPVWSTWRPASHSWTTPITQLEVRSRFRFFISLFYNPPSPNY